jgi:quercetin dioxygenase-like cupin family protein
MGVSDERAERVAVHAQRPGFHISELRMGPNQRVPWHYHSCIHDTLYVLKGRIRISLQDPDEEVEVELGETFGPIAPGRRHLVTNPTDDVATFLVLQGMGEFDFVEVNPTEGQTAR